MKTLLGGLFIGMSLFLVWFFIVIQLMGPSEIRTFLSIIGGFILGSVGMMISVDLDLD